MCTLKGSQNRKVGQRPDWWLKPTSPAAKKRHLQVLVVVLQAGLLITSTLNIECLLLPPQNAGAGLPAGEEILKSNSAEWDSVAF